VTRTVSILPIKLAGTSSTARKLVEQLADARQQVVVADPKGDWWRIRSSAEARPI